MPAASTALRSAEPRRGQMVDIGGRRLRAVIEGDLGPTPLIVCEAGAFGLAADFAAIQAALGPQRRSLAYDRAGLGLSDPAETPRDSHAVTDDLRALLGALGEAPPYILVGHSMAAVHIQVFARRWPAAVAGLVFLDGVPAEALVHKDAIGIVKGATRLATIARAGSALRLAALTGPLIGDAIGLSGEARVEKLQAFGSPTHNTWASRELDCWLEDGEQARTLGELDRELPVAVVTAGMAQGWWKRMQADPARRSRSGYVENVARASHASLLGPKHCDRVVRAIDFVVKAALARRNLPR